MLSLLRRRRPLPALDTDHAPKALRRRRQQNIKVTEDCAAAFAMLAEAQGMSRAALFEDMVAERLQALDRNR